MDFLGIDKAIADAQSGVRKSEGQSEAEQISWQTHAELLPGLGYIVSKVEGISFGAHQCPADPTGSLDVRLLSAKPCAQYPYLYYLEVVASLHITGRMVEVRNGFYSIAQTVLNPSAALKIDLAQDPSGIDKILQHVAALALEVPQHPSSRRKVIHNQKLTAA